MHVVLYQPEIPHNTGCIGRTCVATGTTLWLVRPLGFRLDDHYLRRAGLDYWQHLDLRVVNSWPELDGEIPDRRWFFSRWAEREYTSARFSSADVLIFGRESAGLPSHLLSNSEQSLRIPTTGKVRSLNLATAVGIAIYEAQRQIVLAAGPHSPKCNWRPPLSLNDEETLP